MNKTRIRSVLVTVWSGATLLALRPAMCQAPSGAAPNAKPNILLIVADDLGYGGLGIQGCKDIPTPNMDSIAKNGVRFTNGYVTCPVCAPTRAGLMTGRYPERFGFDHNPGPETQAASTFGLPRDQTTLAERLKATGYKTGMFGKWHLGFRPELQPTQRGFDEFFGFLAGAHSYQAGGPRAEAIFRDTTPVQEKEYLTDALAREAAGFIERHKSEPFFIYLPFNAVHMPMQGAEKYLARFPAITDQNRRIHAAMLSALDDGVGRVLATLREAKLEEKTLIFFISDNGGPTRQTTSSNAPLRGFKGQVWEGGVRIPFFVQWKGRLPEGKVYDLPVVSMDIHATALAVAGITPPPDSKLDGRNILPFLEEKEKGVPHDALYWRFGNQTAVRQGDWKLVMFAGSAPELYNVAQDVSETRDLAAAHPEKVKELRAAYDAWNAQNVAPKWRRSESAQQSEPPRPNAAARRARRANRPAARN